MFQAGEDRGRTATAAYERQRGAGSSAIVADSGRTSSPAASATSGAGSAPSRAGGAEGQDVFGIYPGTGVFVGRKGASAPAVEELSEGTIKLNFANTDVREVVKSILGNTLNANYVIDPRIQGTVTVRTSRPLPQSALIPMLEEILRVNGAALVLSDGLYKVVPIEDALASGVSPRLRLPRGSPAGGFSIQIVPLRYIAAGEMENIIASFVGADSVLRADVARNLLVLAGTRQELLTLLEIVGIFDVDRMAGMSFALFPLESVDAKSLTEDLEKVFRSEEGGLNDGLVRLIPIERLNAILVISPRRIYLEKVKTWIDRLDRGVAGGERNLYVYYVQNARAVDLAAILNEAFAPDGRAATPPPKLAPGLVPARVASAATRRAVAASEADAAAAQQLDLGATGGSAQPTPAGAGGGERRRPGSGSSAGGEGISVSAQSEVRIIADEANNALVIKASPSDYRMIEATLRKLDIVPLQVLIEATIAEVTLTDELRYGLQWFFKSGESGLTLSEVASGAASQTFPGFSFLFSGSSDIRVVLNALESVTDVNIVSSPQLMVLNNQTAVLQVGDQVPVATQSAQSVSDPDAPVVNTIEFRDTGVILRVTPRVNKGGLVIMEIEQEVSDVISTTTSGIDSPTIQQRKIKSTVAVQSGETVALGGLIRDNKTRGRSGIPILSSLPLIGALFGTRTDDSTRTELLVLITPRAISNQQEARAVTEELRRKIRPLIPPGTSPLGDSTSLPRPGGTLAARADGGNQPLDQASQRGPSHSLQSAFAEPAAGAIEGVSAKVADIDPGKVQPFRVQLASYRSAERARLEWKNLGQSFSDLFDKLEPIIVRTDLGAEKGTLYRLRAGPLPSLDAAQGLCRELRLRRTGTYCLPVDSRTQ